MIEAGKWGWVGPRKAVVGKWKQLCLNINKKEKSYIAISIYMNKSKNMLSEKTFKDIHT